MNSTTVQRRFWAIREWCFLSSPNPPSHCLWFLVRPTKLLRDLPNPRPWKTTPNLALEDHPRSFTARLTSRLPASLFGAPLLFPIRNYNNYACCTQGLRPGSNLLAIQECCKGRRESCVLVHFGLSLPASSFRRLLPIFETLCQ